MENLITIKFKKLYPDSRLPLQKNDEDAGFDCFIHHFCIWNDETKKIEHWNNWNRKRDVTECYKLDPHQIIGCALGIASEIPQGYYVNLLPRSGLALKQDIVTVIGTIDSGYRDEWIAIVNNLGSLTQEIKIWDRICQMVVRKMEDVILQEVPELSDSVRGLKGFGSSGK